MEVVEQGDSDFVRRDTVKTVSLTLDEVNDNSDELIEMRGEGRYFGVSDVPSGPVCQNCHQRGHKKAQCKTVVCMACGMVDDHYSQQCPKSIVCSNCGEKGHFKHQCTQKQRRIYCQTCGSTRHGNDRCPSIWRSYLTKNDDKRMGLPNNMYCYNCAEKGHYGDECPEQRSSRIPNIDGSAFSGHNLPKQLRDRYFNLHQKRKREDDDYRDQRSRSYSPAYEQRGSPGPTSKKKGLLDRLKGTFKSNKKDDYDDGPSQKKSKMDKMDTKKEKEVRKSQSTPSLARSGNLPPRGPASYDYPRNPNYNPNYGSGYGSGSNYNNGGYGNSYNGSQGGYARSGYLEPPRPNRSGNISGSGSVRSTGRHKRYEY